jgi:molybdopterin-containing oxidoreductase family membrane subunit
MNAFFKETIIALWRWCRNEWAGYSVPMKRTIAVLSALTLVFIGYSILVLGWGLGFTGMDNRMTWGMWIVGDLSLIVLGGGAFFTSFLLYIFRREEFKPLINSAVLIGWLCYTFTFVFLLFDVGQPLRAWFGWIYPNWGEGILPVSMLTEVFFCISIYWCILCVELFPIALGHHVLQRYAIVRWTGRTLHVVMWIFAAAGTFLSFFHQGSLGGTYGVLFGRPGWFRHETFFQYILSAAAAGPAMTVFITFLAGKIMRKDVVPYESLMKLARVSGLMFIAYLLFYAYNMYVLIFRNLPAFDREFTSLWGGYYGLWMLCVEIALCLAAAVILNAKPLLKKEAFLAAGTLSAVLGISMNRLNDTIHGFSIPNFPWQSFAVYSPTLPEWGITIGCFAMMILIYMLFVRCFPIFPPLDKKSL